MIRRTRMMRNAIGFCEYACDDDDDDAGGRWGEAGPIGLRRGRSG